VTYRTWTSQDALWQSLSPYQRAAAMALLEADNGRVGDARNALGAMVNRARAERQDLGAHVSRPIYQPTIEPTQRARLPQVIRRPEFFDLTNWAERRWSGQEADPVQGATHFLAPERTMLQLEEREPNKYRSWRSWTGFDPASGQYQGVLLRDGSHAFLRPAGLGGSQEQNAFAVTPPTLMDGGRDQPPMASARQQSPSAYGQTFQSPAQQNAFSTPKWGSDQYGTFIDWSDSKGRALERGRSYV